MGYGIKIAILIMMIFILPLYFVMILPNLPAFITATQTGWLNLMVIGFWIFGFIAVGMSFARP